MRRELTISIQVGDALQFEADVLVLKYAQNLYGLDKEVFNTLEMNGLDVRLPGLSGFSFQSTNGVINARNVLFVGVEGLRNFGYQEIREFARKALVYLASAAPQVVHVALTIHGPGYGLDETEAFESELAGLIDAVTSGEYPEALTSITFVEFNFNRANRLSTALDRILPKGLVPIDGRGSISSLKLDAQKILRTAGYSSTAKSHVFVAMPFAEEMDDVFYYGIKGAINSAGLLCERADLSAFTGDVMDWVKRRISSASLVIADLSSANPNVYLEVGYAWGCRVPTVLLARNAADLKFDVKNQRCILYKSIKNLEDALTKELQGLQRGMM